MKPARAHPRFIDMAGQRFGRLTVLRLLGRRGPQGFIYWRCACDCGRRASILGTSLRAGVTRSCGCMGGAKPKNLTRDLTHDQVRRLLSYSPRTGLFRWKISPAVGVPAGTIAGKRGRGYVSIQIGRCKYRAHRLAWFYMTGEWPVGMVDHRDNDGMNNRWRNLREATRSQNGGNSRCRRNGLKGAYQRRDNKKWFSIISINNRRIFLGYQPSERAAHKAYMAAARKHRGEFARAA